MAKDVDKKLNEFSESSIDCAESIVSGISLWGVVTKTTHVHGSIIILDFGVQIEGNAAQKSSLTLDMVAWRFIAADDRLLLGSSFDAAVIQEEISSITGAMPASMTGINRRTSDFSLQFLDGRRLEVFDCCTELQRDALGDDVEDADYFSQAYVAWAISLSSGGFLSCAPGGYFFCSTTV